MAAGRHPEPDELALYSLGLAEPEERADLGEHVLRCEECRREVERWAQDAGELWDLVARTPPPRLRARVLEALRRMEAAPPRGTARPGWASLPAWAAAGALALAGFLWAWGSYRWAQEREQLRLERDSLAEQLRAAAAGLDAVAAGRPAGLQVVRVPLRPPAGAVAFPAGEPGPDGPPGAVVAWVDLVRAPGITLVLVHGQGLPAPPPGRVWAVSLRPPGDGAWRVEGLLLPDPAGGAVWIYAAAERRVAGVRVTLERASRGLHGAPAGPVWLEALLAGSGP